MPEMSVPRSSATVEIETFITVLSSTMMNCETLSRMSTNHFPMREQ